MTDAREQQSPTTITATDVPTPVVRSTVATDVALISTFAAFIAVCAILPGIPTPSGVPITLQTFGVMLAGLVLGWRRGALAVLLYLAVGLAGVPIFAEGTGGVVVLTKPSVGYLLAFPFGAALAGALAGPALRLRFGRLPARARGAARYLTLAAVGLVSSLLTIHVGGIVGLMVRLDATFGEALAIDAVYLPGDVVKNLLAAAVALAVFRAFPDLLRTRR